MAEEGFEADTHTHTHSLREGRGEHTVGDIELGLGRRKIIQLWRHQ